MLTAAMATWCETANDDLQSERMSGEAARWLVVMLRQHDVEARIERAQWGRRNDRVVIATRADIERVHALEHAAWEAEQARLLEMQAWRNAPVQPIVVDW